MTEPQRAIQIHNPVWGGGVWMVGALFVSVMFIMVYVLGMLMGQ